MKNISDQVILITGATDGLGKEVALHLAAKGASLLIHGRNPEKGKKVLEEIKEKTGNNKISYYNADFSSLNEVRQLAEKLMSGQQRLDILINNAGIGGGEQFSPREVSRDGYELRFAVNYLAPFLLTHLLLPLLMKSDPARIINVASGAQESLDFDNLMLEKDYRGWHAYAQSKLALVMFTFSLSEMLKRHKNICVNCLHPATLMDTQMVREAGRIPRSSVEEGVDAVLYAAVHPDTESKSGLYYNQRLPERAHPQAYDEEAKRRLFELSLKITGIKSSMENIESVKIK